MKNPELVNKLTRQIGKMGLQLKKHSPEILVIGGVIGAVASAVMACKATTKVAPIVEHAKENIDIIHKRESDPEAFEVTYTEEENKKDLTRVYLNTGLQIAKVYAPSVALGALSVTSILAGSNILHKRNVALTAAYASIDGSFKEYRKNVVDRFGEEMDQELRYNIKTVEVEEVEVDENGEEKTVKKTVKVAGPIEHNQFSRCFDDGCNGWQKDAEHNLWILTQYQQYANQKLKSVGYLHLNDVYEMLGFPKTKEGTAVGWVYNENNPNLANHVDFGIFNMEKEANRDFVNGYERTVWLDFNVDGVIYDLM